MVFIKAESRSQNPESRRTKKSRRAGVKSQNLEEKKICESGSQPYHSGF
jgi:hypothetical protein